MPPPSGLPEEYDHAMQLHSAVTSSSSLTGTPDDVPQLPVGQARQGRLAPSRGARASHRSIARRLLLIIILILKKKKKKKFFFFFFFFFLILIGGSIIYKSLFFSM